jgi:hypothetical protein
MYAMLGTRPDLAYAIGALSKHVSKPRQVHLQAVERVLRYLSTTKAAALTYGGRDQWELLGYCDADFAADRTDRKSVSGYAFTLGNGAISWSSKKQTTVALSTIQAEYVSLAAATQEAVWLRQLLADLGHIQKAPTCVFNDNQGCIAIAVNSGFYRGAKHFDVKLHYTRECIANKTISVAYRQTQDMPADVLTKALARVKHNRFAQALGLSGLEHSSSGSVEVLGDEASKTPTMASRNAIQAVPVADRGKPLDGH